MTNNEAILFRQPTADSHNSALVSIIIPAYNTAKYIHRAIESSLRQTHQNVEVLVVDDGSTDETLSVAQGYIEQDGRLRVFHQENAGVSSARNHGIREAKGEYLVFLDSDDWLEDNAVELLLATQAQYPDRLITSAARYHEFDKAGRITIKRRTKFASEMLMNIEQAVKSFSSVLYGNINSSCFKLLRRDILSDHNIRFNEGIAHNEDGLFVFEYLLNTNGAFYMNRLLWNVLAREESSTHTQYTRKVLDDTVRVHEIMTACPEITPEQQHIIAVNRAFYLCIVLLRALESKVNSSELRLIKAHIKPYQNDFMLCQFISAKQKIKFFLTVCVPVPIAKCFRLLWKSVKIILHRE